MVLAISTALNAAYFLITIITLYQKPPHDYVTRMRHPWLSTAALAVFAALLIAAGLWGRPLMALIRTGVEHLA